MLLNSSHGHLASHSQMHATQLQSWPSGWSQPNACYSTSTIAIYLASYSHMHATHTKLIFTDSGTQQQFNKLVRHSITIHVAMLPRGPNIVLEGQKMLEN